MPVAPPGLRLPTSNNDPRFDGEDGELEADREPGCCPCQHPPPGQVLPPLEAQEASFQKKFENFLHNAITIPKCVSARESQAGKGKCSQGPHVDPMLGCCLELSKDFISEHMQRWDYLDRRSESHPRAPS